jgi:hypothetical protein
LEQYPLTHRLVYDPDSQFISSFIETDEGFLFENTASIRIAP